MLSLDAKPGPQPVRVAFVGGLERLERMLVSLGAELGLDVRTHNGHTGGGGSARLASLVQRTDLVVIVTGTNSHGAVHIARREAARSGARVRIVKVLGSGTARAILEEIARAAA
jgi:hypothetical protein